MKIKSISLTNFRQFMGSHKIDLSTSKDKPFNIVLGNNGFGKTTTYRAISWCLFNNEPRLTNNKKEYQAERLNFKVVQQMLINETEYVSVKIIFIDDDGNEKTIERSESYQKIKDKTETEPVKLKHLKAENQLEVTFYNSEGLQSREDEHAEQYIENNIINSSIKDFFFFDGQGIQDFVADNKADKIEDHLNILTGITDMTSVLANLRKLRNDVSSKIPKTSLTGTNPESILIQKQISVSGKIEKGKFLLKDIEALEDEIVEIKAEIDNYVDIIKKNEATEKIYKEVEIIDLKKIQLNEKYEETDNKYKTDILESFANTLLRSEIDEFDSLIAKKIKDKELPPPALENVEDILNLIIDDDQLVIKNINSKLKKDKKSYASIKWNKNFNKEKFLEKISEYNEGVVSKRKSQIANIATHTKEFTANILNDSPSDVFENAKKSYDRLKNINNEIDELNKQRGLLMEEIGNYDKKALKKVKKDLELAHIKLRVANNSLTKKATTVEENIKFIKEDNLLIENLKKNISSSSEALIQLNFIEKSINLLEPAIEASRLEALIITNERFKKLVDNTTLKTNFWNIKITDNYNLSIRDKNNNNLLPKNAPPLISTGEQFNVGYSYMQSMQEGLELSFPMLIDTPLSAVDEDLRAGIMKNFIQLKKKNIQTTFFFTNTELTKDIFNMIKSHTSNFYEIKISDLDEDNAIVSNYQKRKI